MLSEHLYFITYRIKEDLTLLQIRSIGHFRSTVSEKDHVKEMLCRACQSAETEIPSHSGICEGCLEKMTVLIREGDDYWSDKVTPHRIVKAFELKNLCEKIVKEMVEQQQRLQHWQQRHKEEKDAAEAGILIQDVRPPDALA